MLQYLHIENIAVIEKSNIEFAGGFHVLTGETGAGKSIIIDSLLAVLGERTSRELIRNGCDKALVSACFSDIGTEAEHKLNELGLGLDQDGSLIIQRTLSIDGKGSVRINSQPSTVSVLKELGRYLVNIHGQHDSQALLDPQKHIIYLDAFANNEKIRQKYFEVFAHLKRVNKELSKTIIDADEKAKRIDLLRYQIDELTAADIKVGEIEELNHRLGTLRNAEKITAELGTAVALLQGNEDGGEPGASDLIKSAVKSLLGCTQFLSQSKELYNRLSSLRYELESVTAEAADLLSETGFNPEELEEKENRLDFLQRLMVKYGQSEPLMLSYLESAQQELAAIELNDAKRAELEEQLEPIENELIAWGEKLTASRIKAGKQLADSIVKELNFLEFSGAQFVANITQSRYTSLGCDTVEFLISANAGEPPKPLAKIASGGELSRIMLAIRSILSMKDDVQTLIFDEIDTGISGRAAQKVGYKMRSVSTDRQVICVTHLAQIAALADHHLLISKVVKDSKTFTEVNNLNKDERIKEIARIMSGGELTENLYKTAEEMLSGRDL